MSLVTAPSPVSGARRAPVEIGRQVDWILVAAAIALSGLGLLMIYSSTRSRLTAADASSLYFVQRQAAGIVIGLVVMTAVMLIDYRRLRDYVGLMYLATIPLLVGVMAIGATRRGTQAWFQVGPIQFQPSEIVKVVLVLALASYCAQHRGDLDAWRLAVATGIAALPIGLVLVQPDLGTALVLGVSALAILLVAGIRGRHLAMLLLVALTLVGTSIATGQLAEYQVERLTGFINASDRNLSSPDRTVYNLNQSKIAIASGGLAGKGFLHGRQTQLGFVPEQHTDFIFTAVGEELGFVGGAAVLGLLALLVWRIWRAALYAPDFFGTLLCLGVLAVFAFEVFENVGMTMGIMPITGIPLPFVSYAPSATIAMFAAVGVAANVHLHRFA